MPKRIDDIITSKGGSTSSPNTSKHSGKSIRDIPIPEGRRAHTHNLKVDKNRSSSRASKSGGRVSRSKTLWIAIGVGVVVLVFAILSLFAGGTLAYTPRSVPINFAGDTYTASKTGEGGLLYSVVKLSAESGKAVPATGEEEVERSASGTIIVYNDSSSAQPLIATTRFQTPDSKVYRIREGITVPARKSVGGSTQPGTVEAVVYADEPGESYNIGLTDFTLPGLAGSDKFKTVYARSKTPMAGGLVGTARTVSEADKERTQGELQAELRVNLIEDARAQVPEDFVLFPTLSTITYDELPQTDSTADSITVNLRGNLYGVMFKKSDLAKYLAERKVELSESDAVALKSLDNLTLSFVSTPPVDLLTSSQIEFQVTGDTLLVWQTDESALRADLAGRHKRDTQAIVNNYPSIAQADVTIRPFWKSTFPGEAADITLKRLETK